MSFNNESLEHISVVLPYVNCDKNCKYPKEVDMYF